MQVNLSRIDLVCVGAPGDAYARLIDDYERRLRRYVRFEVRQLRGAPLSRGAAHSVADEAPRILGALDAASDVRGSIVALDPAGTSLDTPAFARTVLELPRVTFVVGGAAGLADDVRARADRLLALGPLTLPHQLARLVLVEQLYRAYRIARGEPYHL